MEAIGGKTWIHIVAAGAGNQPHEIWLSFPRDVAASRNNGHHIRYDDLRTGVSYQYLPHDNKLFRCSVEAMAAESFRSIAGVFQAIFRGDVSLGERFFEYEIVRQRQRTVDDRGQSWIEYELDFEFPNQTAAAVIRVDPKAMLPSSLTFTVTSPNEEMRIEFAVDYPDDGPADIYAIGVPRDAPVEDRLPSAELTQVLEAIDQGRRDLDNYFAIVASSPNDLPRLVWRKGDKWRVDICQPTERTDYVARVEPGTDMLKWWRERLKLFCTMPYLVCDGRQIDRCGIEMEDGKPASSGWKLVEKVWDKDHTGVSSLCDSRSYMVELRAYPPSLSAKSGTWPHCTIQLEPHGENGPAGSVRVEILISDARKPLGHKQQFWLDPQRNFVLVRQETTDLDPASAANFGIHELDDFRQSPRGVWYPTVIRWKTETGVQTRCYYLDFNVELPDELFKRQAS
jgi:hypothetical protein